MRRVWNETTSDEKRTSNSGYGGVKVGDYGQGGRVYTKYRERSSGGSGQVCSTGCMNVLYVCTMFAVTVSLYFAEKGLHSTQGCINEASESAVTLPNPIAREENNDRLVFAPVPYPPTISGPAPRDEFFGIEMPHGVAIGKRNTEYCQWSEMRHSKTTKVGQKPDFCVSANSESDSCRGVSCGGKPSSSCTGPCCRRKKGADITKEEVWFTYHKAWRSTRIQSATFDNPAAYYNPQRDPAPTLSFYAGGKGLNLWGAENGLHVSARNLEAALRPFKTLLLDKATVDGLSQGALQAGFGEADHQYFYSRVPKDGMDHPVVRSIASYLIDGVIDVNEISKGLGVESLLSTAGLGWITKGTCNAGDVRVSFSMRNVPNSASILGKQTGGQFLVPHTYSNGKSMIIAKPKLMDLQGLLASALSDERWWTNIYRGGIMLLCVLGGLFRAERPGLPKTFAGQLLLLCVNFSLVWWHFYGLRTAAVVPGLTFFTILGIVALADKFGGGRNKVKGE